MIKVLHVFGKMNRGGAEMRTVELLPLLKEKGIHLDFCTLSGDTSRGQLDQTITQQGSQIYPCPLRPGVLTFGRRFKRFLKQHDYDVVHSHVHYASGYMVHLARKAGIQSRIVHFRNTIDGAPNTLSRKVYRQLMRRMIDKNATGILAVCRGAMEFGWGPDFQNDPRTQVIYNGLDLSRFEDVRVDKQRVSEELNIPSGSRLVINVAHIHRQKAHDILLRAFAQVLKTDPKTYLLLIGDGNLRSEMEKLTVQLEIADHVRFLGVRADVAQLLKASDVFVLASLWEGLPGVVLEAVAAGLPVVATDLPGVREIAEHTEQIDIVPVADIERLTRQLVETLQKKTSDRQIVGPFPSAFRLDHCADQLAAFYRKQTA